MKMINKIESNEWPKNDKMRDIIKVCLINEVTVRLILYLYFFILFNIYIYIYIYLYLYVIYKCCAKMTLLYLIYKKLGAF